MYSKDLLHEVRKIIQSNFHVTHFFDNLQVLETEFTLMSNEMVKEKRNENARYCQEVISLEHFQDIHVNYTEKSLEIKNLEIVSNIMESYFRDVIDKSNEHYIPNASIPFKINKLLKEFNVEVFSESIEFNFIMGRVQDFMYYDFADKFIQNDFKRVLSDLTEKTLPSYSEIFKTKEAFDSFERWLEKSDDTMSNKVHFIYQRLKKDEQLVSTITPKGFTKWLVEKEYASEKDIEHPFKSYKNICSQYRNSNFDKLKNILYLNRGEIYL